MTAQEFLVGELGNADLYIKVSEVRRIFEKFLTMTSVVMPKETIYEMRMRHLMALPSLRCKTRKERIVKARQIIMWYLQRYKKWSSSQAGEIFAKDHATAYHALGVIDNIVDTKDPVYYPVVVDYLKMFGEKLKTI